MNNDNSSLHWVVQILVVIIPRIIAVSFIFVAISSDNFSMENIIIAIMFSLGIISVSVFLEKYLLKGKQEQMMDYSVNPVEVLSRSNKGKIILDYLQNNPRLIHEVKIYGKTVSIVVIPIVSVWDLCFYIRREGKKSKKIFLRVKKHEIEHILEYCLKSNPSISITEY